MKAILVLILVLGFFCQQEVLAEESGSLVVAVSSNDESAPYHFSILVHADSLCSSTDAEKQVIELTDLPPGEYELVGSAIGMKDCAGQVTVEAGRTTVVEVQFEPECGSMFVMMSGVSMINHNQIGTVRTVHVQEQQPAVYCREIKFDCNEEAESTVELIGVF